MSRLNKGNTEIEKRRSNVKTTNKLNFDRKNAPYERGCFCFDNYYTIRFELVICLVYSVQIKKCIRLLLE